MRRVLCALTAGLALGLAGQALAADSPENLVKYRQSVMKAIGGHTGAIAAVVKGEVSFGAHVANHARGIKDMSLIVPDIFPANSGPMDYADTGALPEIWEEPAKFKLAVSAFQSAAAKFADIAEAGDRQAIADGLGALGKTCGGCHKPFRKKKE
ncbi:MAG: cytochrome c [Rhodospirillales bacterium]|nr:cytochrome c [Rhodospirillales bacterium]MDH3791610.1 cytochrome c [Rhodospirillales bacterium]MDH3910734.1 cytochrome c [Rhodospirillales bacterium]MDH3917004.1 cytochrome c [Rhodospirillales bacterium]MDH3968401.1 cytochrome c [Rhodospirillales bacterium]